MATTAHARHVGNQRAPRHHQMHSRRVKPEWVRGAAIVSAVLLISLALGSAMDFLSPPSQSFLTEGTATLERENPLPPLKN